MNNLKNIVYNFYKLIFLEFLTNFHAVIDKLSATARESIKICGSAIDFKMFSFPHILDKLLLERCYNTRSVTHA
jgi:hypothetical protein